MKPEYELAKTLIRNRAEWTGDVPSYDPWGFLMNLSFDLADHLFWNEAVSVNDYRPGVISPDEFELADLKEQFEGYPVDMLLEVANGPFAKQAERLRDLGLDY